jgi:hypothetical protein
MADYIVFANSVSDCQIAKSVFPDATAFRINLQSADKTCSQFQSNSKLWLDTGADGLHWSEIRNAAYSANPAYKDFVQKFVGYDRVADPAFQQRPDKTVVAGFVNAIFNFALKTVPHAEWISVPQLPYVDASERNKINRALADASAAWMLRSRHKAHLILPVILTNQRQLNKKTERNAKVALAASCLESSGAQGIWVVDSSLNDQDGTSTFEHTRFPGVLNFHEELSAKIPAQTITIGGPYWGINLILWARGLIRFPGIGAGKSYQYHISGGRLLQGATRFALSPLRRLVGWSPAVRAWLQENLAKLPKGDTAYSELLSLERLFQSLQADNQARMQVARFYGDWFKKLETSNPASRALALYQDFSSAFVLGKSLTDLPSSEKVRSPARIAKQFMVNCL